MAKTLIVGIAGGSGSGKTTLGENILKHFGKDQAAIIYQDSYYFDQSKRFDHDGGSVNFDHPDSLEFSLLAKHLNALKHSQSIQIPIYDFKTHSRSLATQSMAPRRLILVDGILILSQPEIVKELDFSIFVEAPEAVRFERRLHRDVTERGRTPEGVKAQFEKQVKPMHDLFVEPSKAKADLVLSGLDSPESMVLQAMSRIGPLIQF